MTNEDMARNLVVAFHNIGCDDLQSTQDARIVEEHIAAALDNAEARGRAKERTAIVAWLCDSGEYIASSGWTMKLLGLARDIERGAHTEVT